MPVDNAYDFQQTFFPDVEPYRWQIEQLLQLSGHRNPYDPASKVEPTKEHPLLVTLLAANGSGKDQIVLSIWALWEICCHIQSHWIGTSSSYVQLSEQTWRHIKARAEQLNQIMGPKFLEITKFKVRCAKTGSEVTLFRTDEGKLTEGWHPLVDGGRMAIVLNECKSLTQELVMSFKKCHGYTHWVNVSSSGDPFGYFYEKCVKPDTMWPAPVILGQNYYRKITAADCPHLTAEFERDVAEFGIDSPYIQSSYLSNFIAADKLFIIPPERIIYAYPKRAGMGLPRRAGIDPGLGGDSTVISIWEGNYLVAEIVFNEAHEPTLTRLIVEVLRRYDVEPGQVYCDAGNFGQAIIPRIREEGLSINGVHNQSSPHNKKVYKNRGAETAMNFARLVTDKILNLDKISDHLKRQMTARFYFVKEGKIQLEDKKEFRARCGYSPNHFDAAILAHVGTTHNIFKSAGAAIDAKVVDPNANWRKEWESIYGPINQHTARSGQYRTSGIYGRREIGRALHQSR